MNPEEIAQVVKDAGPVAGSVVLVLTAMKAWKSEAVTGMLTAIGAPKLAWGALNPAQKTGLSVVVTILTAVGGVLTGASPWVATVNALMTFASAQTLYTTYDNVQKTVEAPKEYTPSVSRPSSLETPPVEPPNA